MANPILPMYCDWTLDDGEDCMMLAVAVFTTENHEHWTCMPHAREFYHWLRDDYGDGTVTMTPLYHGDSHEAAAAERAYRLAHVGEESPDNIRGVSMMARYLRDKRGQTLRVVADERNQEVVRIRFADGSTLDINDFGSGDWEYELVSEDGADGYGGSSGITSKDIVELVEFESDKRGGPARG